MLEYRRTEFPFAPDGALLAIAPVVALGFGIAKIVGLDRLPEKELMEHLSGCQEEAIEPILDCSQRLTANTPWGLMAGAGVVISN